LLAKKRQDTALIQGTHVIVDDLREQARSYTQKSLLAIRPESRASRFNSGLSGE
jgi:F0F1-type ATP synthase alpha subunit